MSTALDLKDVFLSLPSAEASQPVLPLMDRPNGRAQQETRLDQIALGERHYLPDSLLFCQKPLGKTDYKRATEGLLQPVSYRTEEAQCCTSEANCLGFQLRGGK